MKRYALRTFVALVAALTMVVAIAPAAEARSNTKDKRVLLIHGYDPWGTPTSNCDMWASMESALQAQGFTGPLTSVGYYDNQVACDVSVIPYGSPTAHYAPSGGVHDRYASIRHLGYELAWTIYERYSKHGQTVDVVAHSMGGLITMALRIPVEIIDDCLAFYLGVDLRSWITSSNTRAAMPSTMPSSTRATSRSSSALRCWSLPSLPSALSSSAPTPRRRAWPLPAWCWAHSASRLCIGSCSRGWGPAALAWPTNGCG